MSGRERLPRWVVVVVVVSAIVTVLSLAGTVTMLLLPSSAFAGGIGVEAADPTSEAHAAVDDRSDGLDADVGVVETADEPDPEPSTQAPAPQPVVTVTATAEPVIETGIETIEFMSPSGNLRCRIADSGWGTAEVICQQAKINYALPSQACSAGADGVVVGMWADGGTSWPCLTDDIEPVDVLELDTPLYYEGITCTISIETGIICGNDYGDGFQIEFTQGVSVW